MLEAGLMALSAPDGSYVRPAESGSGASTGI
jgi:hypothetical protein